MRVRAKLTFVNFYWTLYPLCLWQCFFLNFPLLLKAALRGETPFSSGEVTEEIGNGLGDLRQERLCKVRLVKLDKGLLLKATQGPGQGGERGTLSPDIEVM